MAGSLHRLPLPQPDRARVGDPGSHVARQGREEEEEKEGQVLAHADHLQSRTRGRGSNTIHLKGVCAIT